LISSYLFLWNTFHLLYNLKVRKLLVINFIFILEIRKKMNTWYFIKCWQDLIDNILRYIEGSNRFNFSLIHYFCTFFLDSLRVFRTTYFYPYSMEVYIFHENNMQWLSTLVFNPVHMIIHIGFHFCVQYIITFRKHLVSPSVFCWSPCFFSF
jgi:hypothetical protein